MEQKQSANSPHCRNILVVSVLNAGVNLGYALTSLNPVTPVLQDLYNSTYQDRYGEPLPASLWTTLLALTMSLLLAGAFLGSITVTNVLQIFTPRRTMIFWSFIAIIGAIIICVVGGTTGSYEAIIIGRFVLGYAFGLALNTGPVVVLEYSARKFQGRYQSMMGMGLSVGGVLGAIIGHPKVLGGAGRWPAVVAISCILPLTYICLSPWIPESPRTLLRQGRREEAVAVLKRMRVADEDALLDEMKEMEKEQGLSDQTEESPKHPSDKTSFLGVKDILKNPLYRRQLLTMAMLYWGAMAIGVNHATLFSDRIFISAGIDPDMVTYASIGVFTIQAISSIIGMPILAKVGCRKLILGALCINIVSHIITVVSLETRANVAAMGYVAVIGILLLLSSSAGGPTLAIWVLAGELTIEKTRPTILKYSGGVFWFTAWLTGFVAPYLEEAIGAFSFLVWMGFAIIYWVLVFFFVPETKGKTSDEIQLSLMQKRTKKKEKMVEMVDL